MEVTTHKKKEKFYSIPIHGHEFAYEIENP